MVKSSLSTKGVLDLMPGQAEHLSYRNEREEEMIGTEDERKAAELLHEALDVLDRAGQLYVAAIVSSAIDALAQRMRGAPRV